jgi:hypothetical protein
MKNLSLFLVLLFFSQAAFAAGKIQDADVKTEAELVSAGATKVQLINSKKIYVEVNGINDRLDNAIVNGQIGGSPSGVVQLLNGGFDNGTTSWTVYKNTAQASPVNGTGGSPTSTLATGCASGCTVTTAALYGKASGVLQHPASNVQGEGVSYDFTIDPALQGKVLSLNGAYKVVSGTFSGGSATTESDVEVYFYDKTNAVLIQPNGYKVTDGGITGQNYDFNASFQTASNSTSYRVIFHYPNTTATAFNLAIDIAYISQSSRSANSPRPQLLGTVTITGCSAVWNTGATSFSSFPVQTGCVYTTSGLALAPSTMIPAASFANIPAGDYRLEYDGLAYNSVASAQAIYFQFSDGTRTAREQSEVFSQSVGSSAVLSQSISYSTNQTNLTFEIKAKVDSGNGGIYGTTARPGVIKVWYTPSIASQINDLGSQRTVGFAANTVTSTSFTNATALAFSNTEYDTHSAWSGSSFTVPEAGKYSCKLGLPTVSTSSNAFVVYKNGAFLNGTVFNSDITISSSTAYGKGSRSFNANSGDLITFRPDASSSFSSVNYSSVSCEKVQGPSQIGPSETIAASYWVSANFAASTTIPINWDTKEFDTHGAVTTSATAWKYIAPASGYYKISTLVYGGASTFTYNIYKNGVIYKQLAVQISGLNTSGSTVIRLNAGEYFDVRPQAAATITGGTLSTPNTSQISIERVGL